MDLADTPIELLGPDDTPLTQDEARELSQHVPGWRLEGNWIRRTLKFGDFRAAIAFVNSVADEANAADHHPDIAISYSRVELALTTHSIGGLSRKDFIPRTEAASNA